MVYYWSPRTCYTVNISYSAGHIFVYIGNKAIGNKKRSGAKININITAITEPKINPNHRTNPPIINPVTKIFHKSLNGSKIIFTIISNIILFKL